MTTDQAAIIIWDYMHMHHELKKSDAILVLGNRDLRVAEYAAKLYLDGLAPILICAGSGTIHDGKPGREKFVNTTEAEVFADIAIKNGVPKDAIIIENESQNTGDNYKFTINKLKERKINPKRIIVVQKPYMERRAYATGKIWLPDVELIMTSPSIPIEEYPYESVTKDYLLNSMVGDLQRIIEYPKKGFQVVQVVPADVLEAYEFLIREGYTEKMILDEG
jgi:uncharacterized SAM-binding protein YcdF (DUF218 family)